MTTAIPLVDEVLDFWFEPPSSPTYGRARPVWFRKDPEFDRLIAKRFGATIDAALEGGLQAWESLGPRAVLACIVVLDQFTRNVYRGSPRSFAGDARALALARAMTDAGTDRDLLPVQRWFCYLPFEHSENLADQDRSIALFAGLLDDPDAGGAHEWALKHREVIVRFGRFPHRNAILGRASTPDEAAYLAQPGAGF